MSYKVYLSHRYFLLLCAFPPKDWKKCTLFPLLKFVKDIADMETFVVAGTGWVTRLILKDK
jgi:hypothetical protein